jgi:acetyl esterase/lipase
MRTFCALACLVFPFGLEPSHAQPVPKATEAEVLANLAFLPEGRTEKLDLYLPKERAKDAKLPLVIFVHGGGWTKGDKKDGRSTNIATVLESEGYAVASINYRLAPEGQGSYHANLQAAFPQNLHDVKSAVRFLRRNAALYGIDPDRIGLMGASAGAHLAVLAAYTQPDAQLEPSGDGHGDTPSSVRVVVGLYGVYDWATFQQKFVQTDEDKELARRASPTTWVDAADPPTFLIHGTKDIYVPHSQTEGLSKVLDEKDVRHKTIVVPGAPHSFDFRLKQQDLKAELLPFLAEHLKN